MKQRVKINRLLLFLMLGAGLIALSDPGILTRLAGQNASEIKQFQPIDKIVHFSDNFMSGKADSIYAYDPAYDLFYSVDGGDHYKPFKVLKMEDIRQNNLQNYDYSVRSKSADGEQPELVSIIIKGQHKTLPIYLKPKQISFIGEIYHTLPVINIIASENNLISDQNGIMVLGQDAWFDSGFKKPFWERNANYKRRGESSKVPVMFQFIDEGKVRYNTSANLQISGNATRSFPQKSFKIKANRAIGDEVLKYHFFGKKGLKAYNSFVIRNSGNDNTRTLFADLLMQKLAKKNKVFTQKGFPVVMYLNGNYWGIYNIRERIDTYLIAESEKVPIDSVTLLEGGAAELKDGLKEHQQQFITMVNKLKEKSDITNADLEEVKTIIKLKSFVDYIILETFYANGDWLHNNAIWYKAGTKKWKWILNDLDYGLTYLGEDQVNRNLFDYLKQSSSINAVLYNALMTNPDFVKLFKQRAVKCIEDTFDDERIDKIYTKLFDQIKNEIPFHVKRWRGNFTFETWQLNCKRNLNFLKSRKAIYLTQLEAL